MARGLFWLIICLLAFDIFSCDASRDPFERMDVLYQKVLEILKNPDGDANAKKEKITVYWESKKAEINGIQQDLMTLIHKARTREERNAFSNRFGVLVTRTLEIKAVLREQGVEL